MSKILDDLRYADSHEWVKLDGDVATVGITDYAQHALGSIVYVDMPEEGDEVTKGEEFGAVESVKAASDLISPVSGEVIEVNSALEDAPELVNQDAFANWIMKVRLSDPSEVDTLLDSAAYAKICEE
jgi:glycine cleavage system H protein